MPYEIEEDDDSTEVPAVSKTLLPNRLPLRLCNLDFLGEQSDSSSLDTGDSDPGLVAYEVESDSSSSNASTETIRPGQTLSESLGIIMEDLEEDCLEREPPGQDAAKVDTGEEARDNSNNILTIGELTDQFSSVLPPVLESGLVLSQDSCNTSTASFEPKSAKVNVPVTQKDPDTCSAAASSLISRPKSQATPKDKLASRSNLGTAQSSSPLSLENMNKLDSASEDKTKATQKPVPLTSENLSKPNLRSKERTKATQKPNLLTLENLNKLDSKLNDKTKTTTKGRKLNKGKKGADISAPRFSAKSYMQDVWEAESSAATSVMSERTKSKLAGISLMAYQDRTHNFLGHYSKLGKAAAVRHLLEKNCNPGTKVRKRGPSGAKQAIVNLRIGKAPTWATFQCRTRG